MIFEPFRYSRTFFIRRGPKSRENFSRRVDMGSHVATTKIFDFKDSDWLVIFFVWLDRGSPTYSRADWNLTFNALIIFKRYNICRWTFCHLSGILRFLKLLLEYRNRSKFIFFNKKFFKKVPMEDNPRSWWSSWTDLRSFSSILSPSFQHKKLKSSE